MRCERAIEILTQSTGGTAEERRFAAEHAAACDDCRNAVGAVHWLRTESLALVPPPRAGAFERAVALATSRPAEERRNPPRAFWSGLSLGAALAAGIAIAVVSLAPVVGPRDASSTPQITMALNETRDVSISLATPEALADAEIHVVLRGAIGLSGFEGQRELRWRTTLDQGTNQLTLPVVALGAGGGQLVVEVAHGDKRRTFLVDIVGLG